MYVMHELRMNTSAVSGLKLYTHLGDCKPYTTTHPHTKKNQSSDLTMMSMTMRMKASIVARPSTSRAVRIARPVSVRSMSDDLYAKVICSTLTTFTAWSQVHRQSLHTAHHTLPTLYDWISILWLPCLMHIPAHHMTSSMPNPLQSKKEELKSNVSDGIDRAAGAADRTAGRMQQGADDVSSHEFMHRCTFCTIWSILWPRVSCSGLTKSCLPLKGLCICLKCEHLGSVC